MGAVRRPLLLRRLHVLSESAPAFVPGVNRFWFARCVFDSLLWVMLMGENQARRCVAAGLVETLNACGGRVRPPSSGMGHRPVKQEPADAVRRFAPTAARLWESPLFTAERMSSPRQLPGPPRAPGPDQRTAAHPGPQPLHRLLPAHRTPRRPPIRGRRPHLLNHTKKGGGAHWRLAPLPCQRPRGGGLTSATSTTGRAHPHTPPHDHPHPP